jgi:hypothetical protein
LLSVGLRRFAFLDYHRLRCRFSFVLAVYQTVCCQKVLENFLLCLFQGHPSFLAMICQYQLDGCRDYYLYLYS